MSKKLTPLVTDLYTAMKAGVICHYMPWRGRYRPNAYYFRNDTMTHCTKQVTSLLAHGLVEMFDVVCDHHKIRIKGLEA
jgi:phage terminase large subunit-like protein